MPIYNSVYALGGYMHVDKPGNSPYSLASVEKYNLETEEWAEVSRMETPRAFSSAVPIQD